MADLTLPVGLPELIDRAVKLANNELPRGHLGASQIGKTCERALWYQFRWAKQEDFDGRMLRLFERGQLEEQRFIKLLKLIGATVSDRDADGNQFSFKESSLGNHFAGSLDAVAIGIPEAPKTWHVVEFKTHNDKSFKLLSKDGVQKAKPEHYAQMQVYMHWTELDRALYMAVNKNDETLYTERVHYDELFALDMLSKARRIIASKMPPEKISNNPKWFECGFCNFKNICHGQKLPDVNCRTCLHSTPEIDGDTRWSCQKYQEDSIPFKFQLIGCEEHRYLLGLVPFAYVTDATADDNGNIADVLYEMVGESHQPFINGVASLGLPAYLSKELKAIDPALIGNGDVEALRNKFEATVIDAFDDDIPF